MNCEYQETGTVQETLRTDATQSIGTEEPPVHQRIVRKIPGVRMGWIDPAESGEKLSCL